jgi:Flp pilus assembly protein TadG
VEFALALPIFVLVFFAIVEFAHLFYVKLTLQQALRQAGRYMVTGQGQADPELNPTEARVGRIKARFCQYLIGTGIGAATCESGLALDPASGGGPGDTVILTATFTKPWFTILFNQFAPGGVNLSVSTTWVNYGFVTVSG